VVETPNVRTMLKMELINIGSVILEEIKIQIPPISDMAEMNEKITKNT
jgi:hypothetical protein